MSRIYDYYLLDTNININFIPIIFKYIKDNRSKCNGFEESINLQITQENIIIEGIRCMTILLLICIKFIIFFLIIKSNKYLNDNSNTNNEDSIININYNQNQKVFKNNIKNNSDLNNKYIEITISSDNNHNQLNTLTNTLTNPNPNSNDPINFLNKYKHKIFKQQTKDININKNIWVSSTSNNNIKKNNITQLTDSINLSESIDSSESKNPYNRKNNINGLYKIGMLDNNNSDISDSEVLFDYN